MELFCCYCGTPRGDRLSCCGENHFITAEEYAESYPDEEDGYAVDAAGTFAG